jgi:hypothetical protein
MLSAIAGQRALVGRGGYRGEFQLPEEPGPDLLPAAAVVEPVNDNGDGVPLASRSLSNDSRRDVLVEAADVVRLPDLGTERRLIRGIDGSAQGAVLM